MTKSSSRLIAVVLLLVAASIGVAWRAGLFSGAAQPAVVEAKAATPAGQTQPAAAGPGPGAGAAPKGPPPAPVELAPVRKQPISDRLSLNGEFKAVDSVMLRARQAGRVQQLLFTEGKTVRRGELLVRFEQDLERAELERAKARSSLAQTSLARAEELFAKGFFSQGALDEARANAAVAAAEEGAARARLDRTEVRAPFTGRLGLKNVSEGAYLREGDELLLLEDGSALHFDFRVPERYLGSVFVGQEVEIRPEATALPIRSTVRFIDTRIDPETRFLQLRAVVPNPSASLRSGAFAEAELLLETRKSALVVPEEALVGDREGFYIWRSQQGKAEKVRVQLGLRDGKRVEVQGPLAEGDLVVVAGQLKIRGPGQALRPVGASAEQAAAPANESSRKSP